MRELIDLMEDGARDDVRAFSRDFNDPAIDQRVQQQAARKNPKWKKSLTALMTKHGFSLIGAGINGAVFQNAAYPFVLKVYRNDRTYDEWLHFARTNRANSLVPRIKGQPRRLNGIFSVVRLELLQSCNVALANKLVDEIQEDMVSYERVADSENPDRRAVANFLRDWEPAFDLSAHNVMQRPNGEMVIVDPLYLEPGREIDW
jgi:hypothetical protein